MRRTERKARKTHTCCFCFGRINAGTRYIDGFAVFEGEPNPWKAHVDCDALAKKFPNGWEGVPPFSEWEPEDCADDDARNELARLMNRTKTEAA